MTLPEDLPGLEGQRREIALQILAYLERHPHASDTVEGISRFWLEGNYATEEVEAAVGELVDSDLVRRTLKPDGEWIYSHLVDPSSPPAPETREPEAS